MSADGFSWLQYNGICFWSRSKKPIDSPRFHPSVDSSVIRLITGIYQRDPRWARRIIRHRIWTNETIEESTWGTVKVAARRVQFSSPEVPVFDKAAVEIVDQELTADQCIEPWVLDTAKGLRLLNESDIWKFLDEMIRYASQRSPKLLALPVSAVLMDRHGAVLSWGVNSAWDFRTEHAETNLIRRWYRQGAQGEPASLWVTLKSCKMCAGWIYDSLICPNRDNPLTLRFRDPDHGPMARLTVLDLGSFESIRAQRRARGLLHASS